MKEIGTRGGEMTNPVVSFSSRDYERSHGRAPRGRGLWVFDVEGCGLHVSSQNGLGMRMHASGTLTEAKAEVRREIKGWAKAGYGVVASQVYVDVLG